ncbi:plasmid pRiA4b ORF-3 family protein [Bacillaceae bacterium S4-13-58]
MEVANMIYEFKIVLIDEKPPVWRTVQIPSSYNFNQLHKVIQLSMNWYDIHMHSFLFKKNTHDLYSWQQIGNKNKNDDLFQVDFHEKDEVIADWFKEVDDRCIYIYDFGDDWRHELILQRKLEPEDGVEYPRCMEGQYTSPGEDSRADWKGPQEVDEKQLIQEINDHLRVLQKE